MVENLTRPPRRREPPRPARAVRPGAARLALASILLTLASGYGCNLRLVKFRDIVPSEPPPPTAEVKPHPLTLVVEIEIGGGLKLNGEDAGTVEDTGELARRLKEIFAERRRTRAYAPGMENRADLAEEERIAKAVSVKAPPSLKYVDVVKVIDAIRGAGGNPTALQVDDVTGASPTPYK